jgi:hypothetical protein
MLTMRHDNHTIIACDKWILGKRLYEERQVGTPYLDVVRKYLLVLERCMGTCMKQSQSKVHGDISLNHDGMASFSLLK